MHPTVPAPMGPDSLPHTHWQADFSRLHIVLKRSYHTQGVMNILLPLPQIWQENGGIAPAYKALFHEASYILKSQNSSTFGGFHAPGFLHHSASFSFFEQLSSELLHRSVNRRAVPMLVEEALSLS